MQKDIKEMTMLNEDAPRLIEGLRHENGAIKQKLKEYFAHLTASQRINRALQKQLDSKSAQIESLNQIISSKNLDSISVLEKKIESIGDSLKQSVILNQDLSRKFVLTEKNLTTENKNFRSKIHDMNTISAAHIQKIRDLNNVVHDKDKEIASLSIYRFNAHNKKSVEACKNCTLKKLLVECKIDILISQKFEGVDIRFTTLSSFDFVLVRVLSSNKLVSQRIVLYTDFIQARSDIEIIEKIASSNEVSLTPFTSKLDLSSSSSSKEIEFSVILEQGNYKVDVIPFKDLNQCSKQSLNFTVEEPIFPTLGAPTLKLNESSIEIIAPAYEYDVLSFQVHLIKKDGSDIVIGNIIDSEHLVLDKSMIDCLNIKVYVVALIKAITPRTVKSNTGSFDIGICF